MKLQLLITPNGFAELNKITAALEVGGCTVEGDSEVTTVVGEVSETVKSIESDGMIERTVMVKEPTPVIEEPSTVDTEVVLPETETNALEGLTLGTERDSKNRLWCDEINTAGKQKRADNTFKRKPKITDEYYKEIIALLDTEAASYVPETETVTDEPTTEPNGHYWHSAVNALVGRCDTREDLGKALAKDNTRRGISEQAFIELKEQLVTEQGPFFYQYPESGVLGECHDEADLRRILEDGTAEPLSRTEYDTALAEQAKIDAPAQPAPAPEIETAPPAPAPAAPAPAPVIETETVYEFQGKTYKRDELATWTDEQIDAHCKAIQRPIETPTPAAPAPVETATEWDYDSLSKKMLHFVKKDSIGLQIKPLIALAASEGDTLKKVPAENYGKLGTAFDKVAANVAAFADGTLTPQDVYGA